MDIDFSCLKIEIRELPDFDFHTVIVSMFVSERKGREIIQEFVDG